MRCFVIQPFSERYQKRYSDIFEKALRAGGAEPYKVDNDPSADILIESIEENIRKSDLCFADISEDNPNVWYELGFAMAMDKSCCIICDEARRTELPFDIRSRAVIFYSTDSPSDFLKLSDSIKLRVSSLVQKMELRSEVRDRSNFESGAHDILKRSNDDEIPF